MRIFYKIFDYFLYLIIFGFILFEEYIWNLIFKDIYLYIKNLNIFSKLKLFLNTIENRYLLFIIFSIPFFGMEYSGYLAGLSLVDGKIFYVFLFYSIKVLFTIPVVIIFNAAKKKLLSFKIIFWSYLLILKIKSSKYYRNIKKKIFEIKNSDTILNVKNKINLLFEKESKIKKKLKIFYNKIKGKFNGNS